LHKDETISTKRNALSQLAKIYDPLGLASPTTLQGKILYREMCEINIAWDSELPTELKKQWIEWYSKLPSYIEVKRTLAQYQQPILEIVLHAFGDASTRGVITAVYAVVRQENGTTQ
jgi:predicted amidohydrolase YtcJ